MINEKNIIAYLEPVVFVYFKINAQYYNIYRFSKTGGLLEPLFSALNCYSSFKSRT